MVLFLLLFLLINPRSSYAQACYWTGNGYNSGCFACQAGSGFPGWWVQQFCQANAPTCTATIETQTQSCPQGQVGTITQQRNITCANPYQTITGAWYTTSNTCQAACQVQSQTQTLNCPAHYSGTITQTRQTTCPSGQWGSWQTTQNTCVQDPPSCQAQSQSQTLTCGTGYTGSTTQIRTSSCPDPYGQPVWGAWTTTTSSCTKSVSNPTNPTSPISPISPTNQVTTPISSTSVTTTQSAPVTVQTDAPTTSTTNTPSSTTNTGGSSAPNQGNSAQSSTAQPNAVGTPKVKVAGLGLALSLDTLNKPSLTQYNPFPVQGYSQSIPPEMLIMDKTVMEYLAIPPLQQTPLKQYIGFDQ